MKSLYFDVVSGASGDMILSSLIDLGVPLAYLRAEFAKLDIIGFTIDIEKQKRSGISASHLKLSWESPKVYRHIHSILDLIRSAQYPTRVYERCEKILMRLGTAEATVHDMPLEKVHFHEIGAVDTIVDIAGICLCLEYLDIDELQFSQLCDGKGTVKTAHGQMPIPVPAVASMIQGFSMRILDVESELMTPTGCAVLTALGHQKLQGFCGTVLKTGYGCGTKVIDVIPNILRVFLVESEEAASKDSVYVIESDMDHISGEIMGDVAVRLMREGALDVSWNPLYMKKGRPGYRLTVLCSIDNKEKLVDTVMIHTRTLGVRFYQAERIIADRQSRTGILEGENVEEKECSYKGIMFTKPEYESLAKISEKTGAPVLALIEKYMHKSKE